MIKPGEIQTIAGRLGLRDTQIEKDYIIGWILRGISQNQMLLNNLAFKGGTALQKTILDHSRISEDIDFTVKGNVSDTKKNIIEMINASKIFGQISQDKNVDDFTRLVVSY